MDKLIEKKDVRSNICRMMSEMLDNPDDCGIYPTTKFMDDMEAYINSLTTLTSQEPFGEIYSVDLDEQIVEIKYNDPDARFAHGDKFYRSPVPSNRRNRPEGR